MLINLSDNLTAISLVNNRKCPLVVQYLNAKVMEVWKMTKKTTFSKFPVPVNSICEKYQNIFNPFNKNSMNLKKFNNLRLVRQEWIHALKQGVLNESFIRNARVCSFHFISSKYSIILLSCY